ncbi:hypothetical protein H9L14_13435 [Sphingomonas sediminicola]|jgi:hypothetical protein|uniref:Uncharacterized protein n=1 Tax=Sphingomonas sediminicola TaxID=386874 RepID=A0ABX6T805_9SPHN|nr:hypothetical protein [Sphingomonas sediminicola]QNP45539.1 hypothetical protein H9L14_13435 [Sphingomonas sediminicola]
MATEIVAITSGVNVVHARQLAPVAADLTAVERHALVVADPIAVFDASGVAAAIVNAREVAVAMILALDPLCAAFVAVRLEVGESAFTATATFHALRLAFTATTLHLESTLPAAAAMALGALHLHLAATTASATLYLLASAAPTLGLGVATMSSAALVGLGGCRNGHRKCRDTGCKDELPHH